MTLLKLRAERLGAEELCAVDSTSRSAWGNKLLDIRYGKSKDKLPLPQTMEVVVYTLDKHMPVYYRTLPGNTPDSRSLETILQDLKSAGFKNIVLITDRGYESIKNLEMYIDKKQRMIMGTKTSQAHVRKQIDAFGDFSHHPEEMEVDPKERIYFKQFDLEYQIEGLLHRLSENRFTSATHSAWKFQKAALRNMLFAKPIKVNLVGPEKTNLWSKILSTKNYKT